MKISRVQTFNFFADWEGSIKDNNLQGKKWHPVS